MSTRPAITRLVLFKHGIAYVERRGPATATFDLTFRRSEMNDALKSLAVGIGDAGTALTTISYDAPTDPDDDLRSRGLLIPPGEALIGLLGTARGRRVDLAVTAGARVTGEVIGVDNSVVADGERRVLAVRSAGGRVELIDLADVRAVAFDDEQTRDDLDFLVDRGRASTTGQNRTVTVGLTGPTDDVAVSYIVQAPVWRVSYRITCLADDAVSIVAMGIVHNPVDEDLTAVDLTLTTGRPSSFDVDLYNDRRVKRVTLDEVADTAKAPTAFERGYEDYAAPAPMAAGGFDAAPPAGAPYGKTRGMSPTPPMTAASLGDHLATTDDAGEYFEYRVGAPIDLKRGSACMVPLLATSLDDARRELIWRSGSDPHPETVLVFDNDADAVLEAGPAVIYADDGYAGESMMPFSGRGATVRLAFGSDPAVSCRRTSSWSAVSVGVRFGDAALIEEVRQEELHTIRVENSGDVDVEVIVELPIRDGHRFRTADALLVPFEQTVTHHRFRIAVSAHTVAIGQVADFTLDARHVEYRSLNAARLESWLAQRVLDAGAVAELTDVLRQLDLVRELDRKVDELGEQRDRIFGDQSRYAEQLEVLGDGPSERPVRDSIVAKLVGLHRRVDEIDAEREGLGGRITDARDAADAALAALVAERSR